MNSAQKKRDPKPADMIRWVGPVLNCLVAVLRLADWFRG